MRKSRRLRRWEDEKMRRKVISLNFSTAQLLIFLLLASCFSLLAGCAALPPAEEPPSSIVWPPPPDKARIRFLKSVYRAEDVGRHKKGWLKKVWVLLMGESTERELFAPYGITADKEGNVYVVDRDTGAVFSFNLRTGRSYYFSFDTGDPEDHPIGISFAKNRVYVTYPNSSRVIAFSKKGGFVREITGGLKRPTGIAASEERGLLYVVDTLGHDIKVFDLEGKHLYTFGKRGENEGEFNYPTHIFVARDGNVYVADELNFRIQVFDPAGRFLFKFGKIGTVPGTFQSPKGVAVDSDGNIYVADAMADSIQIFNREGRLLLFFGGSGTGDGQFWSPAGMFIGNDDGIYITDPYNGRVQVFQYLKE